MSFILIINNRLHLEKKVFLKRIHWIVVTSLLAVSYCSPYSIKDNRSKDNGTQNLPHNSSWEQTSLSKLVLRVSSRVYVLFGNEGSLLLLNEFDTIIFAMIVLVYWNSNSISPIGALVCNRIINILLYDSKFRLFLKKKEIAMVRWIWILGTSQCILFLHD